jgi:hypothetical protein
MTAKQEIVLRELKKTPTATTREISTRTGIRYATVHSIRIVHEAGELGRQLREKEERELAVVDGWTKGEIIPTDLQPHKDYWDLVHSQQAGEKVDSRFINGPGFTGEWNDTNDGALLGAFDGVCAMVANGLRMLRQSKSQLEWEIRSSELVAMANLCFSRIAPVAKRGIYRGLRGDEFFRRLSTYVRELVARGPLS